MICKDTIFFDSNALFHKKTLGFNSAAPAVGLAALKLCSWLECYPHVPQLFTTISTLSKK